MFEDNGFNSLIDTFKQHKESLAEVFDAGLEASQSIPFFGWAIKAWNIKNTFQERKLYRNTKAFYNAALIGNPEELKSKFSNQSDAEDFVDTLVQVLIESEKPYKAVMVSNITNALARGQISPQQANDMNLLILNASIPALKILPDFYKRLHGGKYIHTALLEDTDKDGVHSMLNSLGLIYRWADQTALSKIGQDLAKIAYSRL
ncbi:hypothetical protein ABEH62_09345 [Pantoea eucalypti]|uniref:hypothetical protein n=1 Tax=Pantoea eucalypti TaxID=470933 RepID=UPI0016540FBC|nr:hypothetical protein [Pantoea eucalypti]